MRGENPHKEVGPREENEVDRKFFSQVAIELAWELDGSWHLANGGGHEMIEVSGGSRELQSAKENVVFSLSKNIDSSQSRLAGGSWELRRKAPPPCWISWSTE